jgi:hypothetical protein
MIDSKSVIVRRTTDGDFNISFGLLWGVLANQSNIIPGMGPMVSILDTFDVSSVRKTEEIPDLKSISGTVNFGAIAAPLTAGPLLIYTPASGELYVIQPVNLPQVTYNMYSFCIPIMGKTPDRIQFYKLNDGTGVTQFGVSAQITMSTKVRLPFLKGM